MNRQKLITKILYCVKDSVWDSARGFLADSVKNSVKNPIGNPVYNSVENSVEISVWASVNQKLKTYE